MPMTTETWKDIPGWEGWYQASTEGRVRCLKRGGGFSFGGKAKADYPLVLAPLLYKKGYFKQHLSTCGGTRPMKRLYLHRIIWMTFNGPIPDGLTVNHKDGDKANNRPQNLELASHQEQNVHARRMGLIRWAGDKRPHLTEHDVREIRRLYSTGEAGYAALSRRYNVWPNAIKSIVLRVSWKHIA